MASQEGQSSVVKTRKCAGCGDTGMMPEGRAWTGMETTITYRCAKCDDSVQLKSTGQTGLFVAVATILMVLASFMMFDGVPWTLGDYLWYIGIFIFLYIVPFLDMLPHWLYPVSGECAATEASVDFADDDFIKDVKDPVQRGIIKIEKKGFWRGFLVPVAVIAVVLAVATIIGWINFTYFE